MNRFFAGLFLLVFSILLCSTASAQSGTSTNLAPVYKLLLKPRFVIINPGPLPFPQIKLIAGTVQADNSDQLARMLEGYSVIVRLRDQANNTIFNFPVTLDAAGQGTYQFMPASFGTYLVDVYANTPAAGSSMNICFMDTDPAWHSATLTQSNYQAIGRDFTINWAIGWNSPPCWQ